jgi:hypothetical protein
MGDPKTDIKKSITKAAGIDSGFYWDQVNTLDVNAIEAVLGLLRNSIENAIKKVDEKTILGDLEKLIIAARVCQLKGRNAGSITLTFPGVCHIEIDTKGFVKLVFPPAA